MGQQQLLLIVLGTIIVGIAIAVGITMFKAAAIDAARDAVASDLHDLAARAQAYYRKPRSLGGGDRSFLDQNGNLITISYLTTSASNDNGWYRVEDGNADSILIIGMGKEVVGSDTVEVHAWVTATNVSVTVIH